MTTNCHTFFKKKKSQKVLFLDYNKHKEKTVTIWGHGKLEIFYKIIRNIIIRKNRRFLVWIFKLVNYFFPYNMFKLNYMYKLNFLETFLQKWFLSQTEILS